MLNKLSRPLSADGGFVRVRTEKGKSCEWLEYKAIRLQKVYYNAAFKDNLFLSDWVNSQKLAKLARLFGRWSSWGVEINVRNF